MVDEMKEALTGWWGLLVASPLIGVTLKRVFLDLISKKETREMIDDRVSPLKDLIEHHHEVIDKNSQTLDGVQELLTEVRISMARRRRSDD